MAVRSLIHQDAEDPRPVGKSSFTSEEPLTESPGAIKSALFSRFSAKAAAVLLTMGLAGPGLGCARISTNPPQDSDSTTDTNTDTDTGTDIDTDSDTDTDVDTDTDTDTGTDTSTDTGSDTETGTDVDTDSDSGTDTGTDMDGGTDTDTSTDTGTDTDTVTDTVTDTSTDSECIDPIPDSYADINLTADNVPASFEITVTDTSLVCNIPSAQRIRIEAFAGSFEVAGIIPFIDFEPPTRSGTVMYYVLAGDDAAVGSDCIPAGLEFTKGLLILEADDGHHYVFELADTPAGFLGVLYHNPSGSTFYVSIYDYVGCGAGTPNGMDEIHLVGPAGTFDGVELTESLGRALRREGSAPSEEVKMYGVVSAPVTDKAVQRIAPSADVVDGDILAAGMTGLSVCGHSDYTLLSSGDSSLGGMVIGPTASEYYMKFKLPVFE